MIKFGSENVEITFYPFIYKIMDTGSNVLKIIVGLPKEIETVIQNTDDKELDEIMNKAKTVVLDEENMYGIIFEDYIIYQIRNESFAYPSDDIEVYEGNWFRIYKNSNFIEFMKKVTWYDVVAGSGFENYKHYEIIANNHVIDIISANEPEIVKVIK